MKIRTGDGYEFAVKLSADYEASTYGEQILILPDGEALAPSNWAINGCKLIEATEAERDQLLKLGFPI